MSDCYWEEIHEFNSLNEYRRFVQWIESQVEQGISEEVIELGKHSGEWDDRWFKCKLSGKVWKLSCPDPGYFSGSWLPV
ncbi:hypothetical protein SA496_24255 [Pseudomonas sp. JS3066]|uniref:hypothetical protein n=1 Tax=Pseudomonas sp. JS3066 TaxID=3090665 RepID=UPI002E7BE775|nr:hypothetical protein [Pseudomonas sp. JS3066]WVK92791.1 hypothetical protein SA496_24255 [Pseudomonas sp. JS3066]